MEVTELIEQVRKTNPKLLEGIPDDKAAAVIRSVFQCINETLAGTEEGVVNYASLGRFRVRKVEKDVEGRKATLTRISFRTTEPGKRGGGGRRRRNMTAGDAEA